MNYNSETDFNYFRYLTYSEEDIFWQFYTTTVGRVEIHPGDDYPYKKEKHPNQYIADWFRGRVLNEFQFVYITEGSGRFRSYHGEFSLLPGSLILLIPGKRHFYSPDSDTGWTEYWFGFNGEGPQNWLNRNYIERNKPIYHPGVNSTMKSLFEKAIGYAREEPPCMQQLISSLIPQIFAQLQISRKNFTLKNERTSLLELTRELMEENLYVKFDVEAITSSLRVNYHTLREYFNEHTGLSPYQYFLHMKINKAKELLISGEQSVKEISFKLAFDNPYYFSRLFKKKTGVSPSKWHGAQINSDMYLWNEDD